MSVAEIAPAPAWLEELAQERTFITADDVLDREPDLSRATAHQYLNRLAQQGMLAQVGRGLYRAKAPLAFEPVLPERLRVLADTIQAGLPFAEFTLWSTVQVVELAHMVPTHHVTFVEAERDVAATIYEVLLTAGEHVLLDPSREALSQLLDLAEEPAVIRSRAETMATVEVAGIRTASLEKLLVDLYFGSTREGLPLAPEELGRMLRAALSHYTVNFVLLLAYAERRGIRTEWRTLLSQLRDWTSLPVWVDRPGDAGRQAKAIEAIVAGARGEMER